MQQEPVQPVDEVGGVRRELLELGEVDRRAVRRVARFALQLTPNVEKTIVLTKFARFSDVYASMIPNSGPSRPAEAGGAK